MTENGTGLTDRRVLVGRAWLAGSATWLMAAAIGATAENGTSRFHAAESVWLIAQVLLLMALVGLRSLRPDDGRRPGRVGFAIAILGRLVFVAAEIVALVEGAESETVLPVAAVLTTVGMVTVGVSTLRAGVWSSWRRFTPLAVGVYPLLFMFPLAASGGSPDVGVALWALPTIALGVAVLATAVPPAVDEA